MPRDGLNGLIAVIAIVFICSAWIHPTGSLEARQRQPGTLSFTDISSVVGIDRQTDGSHGAMFADVDADGTPDLYLTYNNIRAGFRANRFYRNVNGVFTDEAVARGIDNFSGGSHGAVWADIDDDGDYDLLVANTYASEATVPAPATNRMLRNDGERFVEMTPPAMLGYADYTRGLLAFDMERDGDLDVFGVNGHLGNDEPLADRNELYRNDPAGFTAITTHATVSTPAGQGATDTDYDGDGDVDVIASNQTGPLSVLRNEDGISFTAVPPEHLGIGRRAATGITTGDLDRDGDLDLILVDVDEPTGLHVGHIYRNDGGTFSFLGDTPLFGGFTAGLGDLDNDQDLDLVLPGYANVLLNDGTGRFQSGPAFPGPDVHSDPRTVAFADIDNDGDLDFALTAKLGSPFIVRNNFDSGSWLKVRLVSPKGQAGAFGAKVRVKHLGADLLLGIREARSAFGYLSQDDPVLHFGLGTAPTVDIEVTFLDGTKLLRTNVSTNQTLTMKVEPPVDGVPARRRP